MPSGTGTWLSRTRPSFAPLPAGARQAVVPPLAQLGDDVIRVPTAAPGSFAGLEYWTTEIAFSVGRDTTGIRYLYTPGQTIHDGGREPRRGTITSSWFGAGWESRAIAFLRAVEGADEPGILILPAPWGALTARVGSAEVRHDPTMAGCDISFPFEECGHTDYSFAEARPPTTAEVRATIPDDADDMQEAADIYLESVASPGITADDLALLLLEMRTMADLYEQGCDTGTVEGVLAAEGVMLSVSGAARLFPDRRLLASVWT